MIKNWIGLRTEVAIFAAIKHSVISVEAEFFLKGSHFTNFLFPWVFKLLPILTSNLKTTFYPRQPQCSMTPIPLFRSWGSRQRDGTLWSPTVMLGVTQRPTAYQHGAVFSSPSRFLGQLIIDLSSRCPLLPAFHKVFTAYLLLKSLLRFLLQQAT